ncbi:MAG TPA: polyvinylalcohol dehydrogenase, partial [Verrucomicrobia bacterium]|nr:polyvinylalcohol dehydrogenase [Verrucomicrobiota bacterium]
MNNIPLKSHHILLSRSLVIFLISSAFLLNAGNWPQWGGVERDGNSSETGLLRIWPEVGPKLNWQVKDIGSGYSTPVVVNNYIYILSNNGLNDEVVKALSVLDGKKLWSARIGKVGNPDQRPNYPGARSTVTIDGDAVYALGSNGDLVCLKANTGQMIWKKDLRRDFSGKPGKWAYAESPLVDGDYLICTPGGSDATLLALNKKNGDVVWKSVTPEGDDASYSSPIAVEISGTKQYVQFLSKGLVGVESESGRLLWRYERTAQKSPANALTPIAYQGLIYSAASRSGGGLVRVTGQKNQFKVEELYFSKKLPNGLGGAVKVGDYLYGTSGPMLQCVEFSSGKVVWENRCVGSASICQA